MKSLVGIGKGLEKSGRLFLEYGDANGSFWVFWGVPKMALGVPESKF